MSVDSARDCPTPLSRWLRILFVPAVLWAMAAPTLAAPNSPAINEPTIQLTHRYGTPYAGVPVRLELRYSGADSIWFEPDLGLPQLSGSGTRDFERVFDDTTRVVAHASNSFGSSFSTLWIRPRPPKIDGFHAWPARVPPGQRAILTAGFEGATSARIDPGVGPIPVSNAGSSIWNTNHYATVDSATTFTLIVANPLGSVRMSDRVELAPPLIDALAVSPGEIVPGESARIDWTIYFADEASVLANEATVATIDELPFGSAELSPVESTDYVIEATNLGGTSRDTVHVEVLPLIIRSFGSSEIETPPGYPTTLRWEIVGTGEAQLEGFGPVALVDSLVVYPEQTRDFVLNARSGNYSVSDTLTTVVTNSPPDFIALSWEADTVPGNRPDLEPGQNFDVWILALSPSLGYYAYEFGLDVPSGFTLVEGVAFPEGAGVNVGDEPSWVVGTGSCYGRYQEYVPLLRATLRYDGGSKLPAQANLRITGSNPSTFAEGQPGFYDCTRQLSAFQIYEVFDLMKPSTSVPVLDFGLSLERTPEGVEVRWDLNASGGLEVLEVVRNESGKDERVLARIDDPNRIRAGRFVDNVANAADYRVRVRVDGVWTESRAESVPALARFTTRLLPNAPNPFNPSTELRFVLGERSAVVLEIFDLAGRRVNEIRTAELSVGEHFVVWKGTDNMGQAVSSGVYLLRMQTPARVDQRRILLLK